jgi:osmoprotectant transport system ATP-binding protein
LCQLGSATDWHNVPTVTHHVEKCCVRFDRVSKKLAGHLLLGEVSVCLPSGRTTAVIGASGSGKSSLLNHINGLLQPDTGTVEVFGRPLDYNRLPEIRRRIGYAVQQIGLFPHMTVRANITLLAQLAGWATTRLEMRLEELMTLAKLPLALLDRYPGTLSGGQQQRVGLCRALMLEPELLLLDEAFSGVDPIARQDIYRDFIALRDEANCTVVLVTHDLREAVALAQYGIVMREGIVEQSGDLADLVRNPASAYVRSLFAGQL